MAATMNADAPTIRSGAYRFRGWLGVITHRVVWSRAVNMAYGIYPLQAITYDDAYSGTGSDSDVLPGMTVIVRAGNTSRIKGLLRVAEGGANGTTLQVSEHGRGVVQISDDDRLDVIDEYRIADMLVGATDTLPRDSRIEYTDQTDDYPPLANANGAFFGFVDDGENYATVTLDASDSAPMDPSNSSGLTYAWDVGDGTITVGTSTDESITATFPAGIRHVLLTVTDADNSATATKRVPVAVYTRGAGSAFPAIDVDLDELTGERNRGWSGRFQLPADSASLLSNMPDGAMVAYFEDEYYGGTRQSYGSQSSDRNHIKFIGYLDRETIQLTPDEQRVQFEAIGPMEVLYRTPALPQILENVANPSTWLEARTLTMRGAIWYLWYWHTTAAYLFDLVLPDGLIGELARIATQSADSVAGQIAELSKSVSYIATCDRLGRFHILNDVAYVDQDQRSTTFEHLYALTPDDMLRVDIPRDHRRIYKDVRVDGISQSPTVAGTQPLLSKASGAPSNAVYGGNQVESVTGMIFNNQTHANSYAGRHYARINGIYAFDDDLSIVPAPQGAPVTLPDGYDFFDPALSQSVTLESLATYDPRGIDRLDELHFYPDTVRVIYDADRGVKDVQLSLNAETYGPDGVKDDPQFTNVDVIDLPPIDWTIPGFGEWEPLPFPGWLPGGGTQSLAIITNIGIWVTNNFDAPAGSRNYTYLSGLFYNTNGNLFGNVVVDAYSPLYIDGSGAVNAWYNRDDRLIYLQDIFGTPSETVEYIYDRSFNSWHRFDVHTERGFEGRWLSTGDDTYDLIYHDGSTTNELSGLSGIAGNQSILRVHLSGRRSNMAFVMRGSGSSPNPQLYEVDLATPQVTALTPGIVSISDFHNFYVPFETSEDDSVLFASGHGSYPARTKMLKKNGASWELFGPYLEDVEDEHGGVGDLYYGFERGSVDHHPMAVYTRDTNVIAYCGHAQWSSFNASEDLNKICVTKDGGATWGIFDPAQFVGDEYFKPFNLWWFGDPDVLLVGGVWKSSGVGEQEELVKITLSGNQPVAVERTFYPENFTGATPNGRIINIIGG